MRRLYVIRAAGGLADRAAFSPFVRSLFFVFTSTSHSLPPPADNVTTLSFTGLTQEVP
jgi:hypothetical protein